MVDLADPSWKGQLAASPTGADFQAIVAALLSLKGEEATKAWLAGMTENFTPYRGNSTVMKAINAGEIEGGIIFPLLLLRGSGQNRREQRQYRAALLPQSGPGRFISVSGGGVLASSQHLLPKRRPS